MKLSTIKQEDYNDWKTYYWTYQYILADTYYKFLSNSVNGIYKAEADGDSDKVLGLVNEIHNYFRQMNELTHARAKLDKELKAKLQSKFENFDEIWGAL